MIRNLLETLWFSGEKISCESISFSNLLLKCFASSSTNTIRISEKFSKKSKSNVSWMGDSHSKAVIDLP